MRPLLSSLIAAAVVLAPTVATAQGTRYSESYTFLEAVRKADGAKLTKILNEPGATVIDTHDADTGEGALHIVAKRSDQMYLAYLLQKGADPNIRDGAGNTPLLLAVTAGFQGGVEALIRRRANPNLGNSSGETPLIRAVQLRNLELVRQLLAAGADPDQTDRMAGMSARDYARLDTRSPALTKLVLEAPRATRRAASGPSIR